VAVLSGEPLARLGIIGGSGLYSLMDGADHVEVDTPYGEPSGPVSVGEVSGVPVAFLARHGHGHRYPAHLVNYRANMWALRSVGVRRVLAPGAVGSLRADLPPGSFVVVDQVVDRTWGRAHTYVDAPGGVAHVGFADPYCPDLRRRLLSVAGELDIRAMDGGTLVVINGPRFSSRAESLWHAAQGWSVVGMTGMPEAALAREQALCYASIALVTDMDAGFRSGDGVTQAEVLRTFAANIDAVRRLLLAAVPLTPGTQDGCRCAAALDGIEPPYAIA
jgi:5'-methylthioadenosine phosphorylase